MNFEFSLKDKVDKLLIKKWVALRFKIDYFEVLKDEEYFDSLGKAAKIGISVDYAKGGFSTLLKIYTIEEHPEESLIHHAIDLAKRFLTEVVVNDVSLTKDFILVRPDGKIAPVFSEENGEIFKIEQPVSKSFISLEEYLSII